MKQAGRFEDVRAFIGELYGSDWHAKRIDSLAGATLGTMTAASLAVATHRSGVGPGSGLEDTSTRSSRWTGC